LTTTGQFAVATAAYSYTLYLTHYTVMSAISIQSGWARTVVTFVVANIVAIALYFAFERHYRSRP
jgi:peptidoglycan/LPS O-acetylase OafA/YrhL